MMLDSMRAFGVILPARLATIIQGSTETTFYVLAVYFERPVSKTSICDRLRALADLAGVLAAIVITYRFLVENIMRVNESRCRLKGGTESGPDTREGYRIVGDTGKPISSCLILCGPRRLCKSGI